MLGVRRENGQFPSGFMILLDSTNILHIVYRPGRQKVSLLSLDCFTASRSKHCKRLARAACCFLSMTLSAADGHQNAKNI